MNNYQQLESLIGEYRAWAETHDHDPVTDALLDAAQAALLETCPECGHSRYACERLGLCEASHRV